MSDIEPRWEPTPTPQGSTPEFSGLQPGDDGYDEQLDIFRTGDSVTLATRAEPEDHRPHDHLRDRIARLDDEGRLMVRHLRGIGYSLPVAVLTVEYDSIG